MKTETLLNIQDVVVADLSEATTTSNQPPAAPKQRRRSRTAQFSVYNYIKPLSRTRVFWMMSSPGTV